MTNKSISGEFHRLHEAWMEAKKNWETVQQKKLEEIKGKYSNNDWWNEYILWYEDNAMPYISAINEAFSALITEFPPVEWEGEIHARTVYAEQETKAGELDLIMLRLRQEVLAWYAIVPQINDENIALALQAFNGACTKYYAHEGEAEKMKDDLQAVISSGRELAAAAIRFLSASSNRIKFGWLEQYVRQLKLKLERLHSFLQN